MTNRLREPTINYENFSSQSYCASDQIKRRQHVLKKFGLSNTTLHNRIKAELFPPPISLGDRAVGWLQSEIDQVFAALVSGRSNDQLRDLVRELVEQRKAFS